MKIEVATVLAQLKAFDFKPLFRDCLGWDNHRATLDIPIDGKTFQLAAVAEKRGFVAYVCPNIPERETRLKIDRQVTKSTHEHIIIYTDQAAGEQVWQWVRRELGRPAASREYAWYATRSGEALALKLEHLATTLDEEEKLTIVDMSRKAGVAFDVEKTTKSFFDRFTKEHQNFMAFIAGITARPDLDWYASLMLNRLMFVYFIQKKGFLDGDVDYLKNRLARVRQRAGKDKFQSFYRYFLLRLFHDGLGKAPGQRPEERAFKDLLGTVPYLNGGFFEVHHLEQKYPEIDIPDAAFENIFVFFESYDWCLDERPTRSGKEINPDVVGYIFEKYINQKQMGAYYTKEDITEYISKNTLIPFLFDAAKKECLVAFEPGSFLWRLLQDDPDRYIYTAVRKGVIHADGTVIPEQELPDYVQTGMKDPNARMFDKRYNLSQSEKDDPIRLPTETWREYIARRTRCLEMREKLKAGEVHEINDLITLNLNIWQFARDAINVSEGPELVRAFWRAINRVTVLDPTCGSGAFLFAALRILETLYSDCLDAMRRFVEGAAGVPDTRKGKLKIFSDFKCDLEIVALHANERYFILKSIIVNNLYGVDIMEEAVEICKLRLFLKLAAQVEKFEDIEPLPDIDFNIRAGNTLVGYARLADLRKSGEGRLALAESAIGKIEKSAGAVNLLFEQFRRVQRGEETATAESGHINGTKVALRASLGELASELDSFLALEYGVANPEGRADRFGRWREIHLPFHWATEFYSIMQNGGFDVVIGNPPYLELAQIGYLLKGFVTAESKAVHAACVERGLRLMQPAGVASMILPLSIICTQRMVPLQKIVEQRGTTWYANFAWRPGKLFDTVNRALTIFVLGGGGGPRTFSTGYQKWNSESRKNVFPLVRYTVVPQLRTMSWVPKTQDAAEASILRKLLASPSKMVDFRGTGGASVFYRTTGGLYWKVFTDFAPAFRANGTEGHSTRETSYQLRSGSRIRSAVAILSSNLFWWWYTIASNLRDLNPSDIDGFPAHVDALNGQVMENLGRSYIESLVANSTMLTRDQKQTGKTETQCFKVQNCKPIIDQIDRELAKHYGFTPEELDFIINYDIKYRMGAEAE